MRRLTLLLPALVVPLAAPGQVPSVRRETVQVVESRSIPHDIADDVSRLFNASSTTRLTGTQQIDSGQVVSQDIAILDGSLTIAGHVAGRLVAINSAVVLLPAARIDRDVTILGGTFDSRDPRNVTGDVRVYGDRVNVTHEADRIVVHGEPESDQWFRRRRRWETHAWSDLRLVSARTYSRVEGLPLLLGPLFGREFSWGRVSVDALGIIRSADRFDWKSENLGHSLKTEISVGKRGGIRVGGQLFDLVDAVEPWQLSDAENGLASFFLHRDYRDYFDRHGGAVYSTLFLGNTTDLTLRYSAERWGSRDARTPFTLFRQTQDWRPNPQLDDGTVHLVDVALRYDTRNDELEPRSGWYVSADFEHGSGQSLMRGPASWAARFGAPDPIYNRGLLDVRRYNRVAPDGQLNLRLVLGGWLGGDDLPLERRFSLGGPGTLPGYDFRRIEGGTDYWQCSAPQAAPFGPPPAAYPPGLPAQCQRIALAQAEYRGVIHVDPLGILGEERVRRRSGWGRTAEWVVFADMGRGWLVGERFGTLRYGSNAIPPLNTFRGDIGIGIRLDDVGVYAAKALSNSHTPVNFFVRLRPRF
jgi:Omp85 superfamily domain